MESSASAFPLPAPERIIRLMKSSLATNWLQNIRSGGRRLTDQRLAKDKLSLGILVLSAIINVATLLMLIASLRPTEFAVPVRYSSLTGFQALGEWYQIYGIALFGVGVTAVNAVLAANSYSRSRITSFFLLIGAFVVSLFCLIISLAFAAII